jgi:RNA polymerase sigma-70 factor (ECF subfamily)
MDDWFDQLADPQSEMARQWDREHDREIVRRLLATIQAEFNPRDWQIFHMLVIEDRPVTEVVKRFAITPNLVYVARSRVLARLREVGRGLLDL